MRRYLLAALACLATFWVVPAAHAQVVTFSDGRACSYTTMTVNPNGNVTVACVSSSPTAANFAIDGPATMAPSAVTLVSVSRVAGPAEIVTVDYAVTGLGCTNKAGTLSFASGGADQTVSINSGASGTCVITLTAPTGHTASPDSITITVDAAPSVPAECASPAAIHYPQSYGWTSYPLRLRMESGAVASFPIPEPTQSKNSVMMTQGQVPETPNAVTEFSISKCPGVIDTSNSYCYKSTQATNFTNFTAYVQPNTRLGWDSQDDIGSRGCWAPRSEGTWYVNVRWTYSETCPYATGCGFSMKWEAGAY